MFRQFYFVELGKYDCGIEFPTVSFELVSIDVAFAGDKMVNDESAIGLCLTLCQNDCASRV